MNLGIAKSNKDKTTIRQHTNDLLALLDKLIMEYPTLLSISEQKILRVACEYHDIGKYNPHFQNKIYEAINNQHKGNLSELKIDYKCEEIYHEFFSLLAIDETLITQENLNIDELFVLMNIIFGHHGREFDYVKFKNDIESYIDKNLNQLNSLIEFDFPSFNGFQFNNKYLRLITSTKRNSTFEKNPDSATQLMKMQGFLNLLDYIASFGSSDINIKNSIKPITELILEKYPTKRPLQQYLSEHTDDNVVLVASTGSGKTEASIFWAKLNNILYTLPLKVAINAIYTRILEDYNYTDVRLLHSDALDFYFNEYDDVAQTKYVVNESKLLQSTFMITTVDQLFKSVYKYRGSEFLMARLAMSHVIIDELQMYSPDILASILVSLKNLTALGGKFCIITATLPNIVVDWLKTHDVPFVMPDEKFKRLNADGTEFVQHRVTLRKKFDIKEIALQAKTKKVLVIANTVKKAQELYRELKKNDDIDVNLLHARFLHKHRSELEGKIMSFADKDRVDSSPGVWVTTSIVEASLDVDFDVLYSELAMIDSLFQRMGRVYRHRQYDYKESNVFIFMEEKSGLVNGDISSQLLDYALLALNKTITSENYLLLEDEKQLMVDMVYDKNLNPNILKSAYYQVLKDRSNDLLNITPYQQTKEDANKKFRDIFSYTAMPLCIYEQFINDGTFDKWKEMILSKKYFEVKSEIKDNTVSVPGYLKDKGKLIQFPNIYPSLSNFFEHIMLSTDDYYFDESEKVGLIITSIHVNLK